MRTLLLLLAFAGAAAAWPDNPTTLPELEAVAKPLMADLLSLIDDLDRLSKLYADDDRFLEHSEKRRKLREETLPKYDRLSELETSYAEMKKFAHLQAVTQGLAALDNRKKVQAEAPAGIAQALALEEFHRELINARRHAREVLGEDDRLYFGTQAAIASRKRRWSIGGIAAGLALILAGAAFRIGKRRQAAIAAASGTGGATIGSVIGGNYRLEREIGRGAMGRVFEATDVTLRRKVAIKRLRDELLASEKELDLFLSEARLVASLKHPNIVEIFSIVKERGELFLVFEFVSGKALHALLQERGRLPWDAARRVAADVGAALDYAHDQKIIHRDLKPANVMIGADGRAKVMDFGIAHRSSGTVAHLTRTEAWGTPPYMAPEAELGRVARESDVYSLGVCIYQMLTGKLPFEGPNFLAQKREMKIAPVSSFDASLGPAVDQALFKALQPEPDARFHSAAQLLAGLDAALPGRS
ncbi:MAG: serine/threonine protein kinase [Elusimicrobia bacterium]|nr:serine/threonine protein kinase [Elusimicrobiota bacterium]